MGSVAAGDAFASSFTTPDGHKIDTRLIRPDDVALLVDLFAHLSPDTRRRRFNVSLDRISDGRVRQVASELAAVDNQTNGGAVLALAQPDGAAAGVLVGVARLARLAEAAGEAEVAVVVRDDYQRRGIGAQLLRRLVDLAQRMGIQTLTASIQSTNNSALALLKILDRPLETQTRRGETIVRVQLG